MDWIVVLCPLSSSYRIWRCIRDAPRVPREIHVQELGCNILRVCRTRCVPMRLVASIALLAAIHLPLSIADSSEVETPVTAIRAGRLIDVEAGKVRTNQVIVVRRGRIESVGAAEHFRIPPDSRVI